MKKGDRFKHYKGVLYTLVGEGCARGYGYEQADTHEGQIIGLAYDSEDPGKAYNVYRSIHSDQLVVFGVYRVSTPVGIVVYASEQDGKWWIRTRDQFMETLPTGIPRFLLLEGHDS